MSADTRSPAQDAATDAVGWDVSVWTCEVAAPPAAVTWKASLSVATAANRPAAE